MRIQRFAWIFILSLALALAPARAQVSTAQLTGAVNDPSGAAIPGADVTVTNVATGAVWNAQTGPAGYYTVPLLPPGQYRIGVQADGFRSVAQTGVTLEVAQVARLDFDLQVGAVTEQIEVTADAPVLESQTASLGQVVGTRTINDLPLNGRNYLGLAKLGAGVVEQRRGGLGADGGSFVANGVRAALNNYNLDGADNNTRIVDIQNGSHQVIQPSVDALQEFKIETANYSAEYGYSAGAVVNATIKSGTNSVHGSAFEFVRNQAFDARDYFQPADRPTPPLQRHQYGGTVGGPIVRDKWFVFGSWERTWENRGLTMVETVPTEALRRGDFSATLPVFDTDTTRANPNGSGFIRDPFVGKQIPQSRFSEVSSDLIGLVPAPNLPGTANNYVANPDQPDRIHRFDTRSDWNISSKDRVFGRYNYLTREALFPGPFAPPLIGAAGDNGRHLKTTRAHSFTLGETHVLSAAAVNEFRFGYSRVFDNRGDIVQGEFLGPEFGFKGIPADPGNGIAGLPSVTVSGYNSYGSAGYVPNGKLARVWQFKDDISWLHGSHAFKAGGQYQRVGSYFDLSAQARGQYSFTNVFTQNPQSRNSTGDSFGDFLLGYPANATLSKTTVGDVIQHYVSAFFQDDWKVTPKLTINLGLRYEIWTPRVERDDLQANFLPDVARMIFPNDNIPSAFADDVVTTVPDGVGQRTLVRPDLNNLAPRFGFAYQLSNKTVLRGGAGMFYMSPAFPGVGATLPGNPPFLLSSAYPTDQLRPNVTFESGFPADALTTTSIDPRTVTTTAFETDFPQGYVSKWSFGVQRQIGGWLAEANYVGTKGTHLPVFYNVNDPFPGAGAVQARRPFQRFGNVSFTNPMGNSSYQGLEARLERRYAKGLQMLFAYTHSKAIDFGGEQLGGGDTGYRNVRDVMGDRSLAGFDMRNRFVASYIYDLPFRRGGVELGNAVARAILQDWQINGVLTLRDGQPFTPTMGFSSANTGAARPDRLRDGNLPGDERTLQNYFDKTAFAAAAQYNFGNAGRNILIGPGAVNLDFSVFRRFPLRALGEAGEIQFRAEFFNGTNTPQFDIPNTRFDLPQGGSITALAAEMRELQFGLKILF